MATWPALPPAATDPYYIPLSEAWDDVRVYIDETVQVVNDELGGNPSGNEGTVALRFDRIEARTTALESGAPPDPTPVDPPTASPELPYNTLSVSELRASLRKVFAHYMPGYSISVDNKAQTDPTEYWFAKWLTPALEGATDHRVYGGRVRQRPLASAIRPEPSCDTSSASTAWSAPTDGWQVKNMELEVAQAISRGIDGFFLLMQGIRASADKRQGYGPYWMMKAAGNVDPGFKCVIMPDLNVGSVGGLTAAQLADEVAALAQFPAAYRLPDGRLLVSCYDNNHTDKSPTFWNDFAAAMLATHSINVAIMPNTNTTGVAVNNKSTIASMEGFGEWGDAYPAANVPGSMSTGQPHALAVGAKAATGGPLAWLQNVFSSFFVPSSPVGYENKHTENIRKVWQIAREDAITPGDIVQLTTWNDYGEHSMVAPTTQNGWFWLDVHSYFIHWYKTGTAPTIVRDAIYLVHRKHPSTGTTFSYAPQTSFVTMSGAQDTVEALVFLTAPATVTIYVGSNRYVQEMVAGMNTFSVPLGVGTVAAAAVRSNVIVSSVTSPTPVSTSQTVQDLSTYGASSLRDDAFNPDTSVPPGGWTTPDYTTTITATADTYVSETSPTTNYGSSVSLSSNGESGTNQQISLIRFAVPANPTNQIITNAILKLRTETSGTPYSAYTHDVRLWDNTWTEGTVTWDTRPTAAGALLGTIPVTTTTSELINLSLNAAALAPLAGTTITIAIVNNANNTDVLAVHSTNYGISTYHPKIDLTYSTGIIDSTPPSAPTGVSASVASTTVSLAWTVSTDNVGVTGYEVHRSASTGFTPSGGTLIASPTALSYDNTGVAAGTWYYKIIAKDAAGNASAASSEVSAVVSAAPTVQTVVASADTYVNASATTGNAGLSNSLASGGAGLLETYMRFVIPAAPGGQTLQSAVLKIRTTTSGTAGSATAQTIRELGSDSWVEGLGTTGANGDNPAPGTGLVYAGRPTPSGATLGTISAPANDTSYSIALDVASVAGYAGTTKSFHIKNAGTADADTLWFWSHEHANAAYRPTLELTYA